VIDPAINGIAQATLALIFLSSALEKAKDLSWFADVLRQYRLVPESSVWPVAFGIPSIELVAAAGLLYAPVQVIAATVLIGLLLAFSLAVGINLARGRRHIDCGCWGPGAQRSELSGWLVVRNLGLAAVASLLLVPLAAREMLWVDFLTVGLATVTLLFLFGSSNRLIANASMLANLRNPHD
jgi:hypothetical protein